MRKSTKMGIRFFGLGDLAALSAFLGEKTFLLGERFTAVDASLFAFLFTILKQPIECLLQKDLMGFENILSYCARLEQSFSSFTVQIPEIRV